jgi:hypothetical protein
VIRRAAAVAGAAILSLLILAVTAVGSLVGLNAECNGAASECPRSTAYRATLIGTPITVLVVVVSGAVVAVRRRSVYPLLGACGAAIVFDIVAGSFV